MAPRKMVIDGANGYVGSNLVHHLVRRGHPVVALARQDEDVVRSIVEAAVVGDVETDPFDHSLLEVVRYSLDDDQLSLDEAGRESVFGEPVDYWHVAASMKYQPGSSGELMAVNVDGTRNTLACYRRNAPEGSRYFLVGTAYSCGLDDDGAQEEWHEEAPPSQFRNYYEYSKRLAEVEFRKELDNGSITGALLRLGPIVGDSRSLRTNNTYGLYQLLESLFRVARRYPGERVRIVGEPGGAVVFVPVDDCVRWMVQLSEQPVETLDPPIVHLFDDGPVSLDRIFTAASRHLDLQVERVDPGVVDAEPLSHLESLVRAGLAFTGPYIERPGSFDCSNLVKLLGERHEPVMSDQLFDAMTKWFLDDMEQERQRRALARAMKRQEPAATTAMTGTS